MNKIPPTLRQRILGQHGERLAFLITTTVVFVIIYAMIVSSGHAFEPVVSVLAAIFAIGWGLLIGHIAKCRSNPEARHMTWNEPRRFFLFLMLVCALVGGTLVAVASQKSHPIPGCIISGAIAAFFFLLAFAAVILSVIPWTRPLMNWVLRRRFFVLTGIVTVIALFYAEENWRGKRAWENYKQAQEAKGEYFDLKHIVPPPVPDEQNFAMAPLFKPEYEYVSTKERTIWNDTNGLARLQQVTDGLPQRKGEGKRDYYPDLGDMFSGKTADFSTWHEYFSGNTNFPQLAPPATPAEEALHALNKFAPELQELTDAATTRPYSRFPIHYDQEPAWGILLPHLGKIKGLTRLICVRAIARLDDGQTTDALADLKLALRLSDSIKDEPLLIDHLVRIASLTFPLNCLRDGLVRHQWDDASLAALEKDLGGINLFAEEKQAMRGERAFGVTDIDWRRRQGLNSPQEIPFPDSDGGGHSVMANGMNFLPSSFYYFNMLNLAKAEECFFTEFDAEARRVILKKPSDYEKAYEALGLGKPGFHPTTIFARLIMPALGKVNIKTARTQSYVDFARIACALERHRIAHGSYPDSLDVLTPKFIVSLPHDVINGQPLKYRREADGYVLYSVGWNEKDDGGLVSFKPSKNQDDMRATMPEDGDWVWSIPAR